MFEFWKESEDAVPIHIFVHLEEADDLSGNDEIMNEYLDWGTQPGIYDTNVHILDYYDPGDIGY